MNTCVHINYTYNMSKCGTLHIQHIELRFLRRMCFISCNKVLDIFFSKKKSPLNILYICNSTTCWDMNSAHKQHHISLLFLWGPAWQMMLLNVSLRIPLWLTQQWIRLVYQWISNNNMALLHCQTTHGIEHG